ncbi:5-deoxy-glucuronate isomerase [Cytobacillus sp. NCCP-133]|uniref:5-deoxy-glucuronate isomerase n=1 Tax=Cytobacillus sp. NCCP-133 TaxID=766848 RepID=UPI0022318DD7|nr:5-deoxy-glucuronate isomerase [Cytobacillus sp. NCCP-133]GLB60317.1 5-deoxy-glucuronate isomerase [Cytobacillus sp. NCCP-133]
MGSLLRKPINTKAAQGFTIVQEVTSENSSLEYVNFKIVDIDKGAKYSEMLGKQECCIVALTGKIEVTQGEQTFKNLGTRECVFEKIPTDSVYVSNDRHFEIKGISRARVALCYSPSDNQLPTKLIKASENSIEHRGVLNNKRMVHNILPDSMPAANSLLVVEVYTDSGNWSSYPPHKHDRDNLPDESYLEETYYHEMNPKQGFVFQRVYTDDRKIDETMTVENGDVVIVPEGYHPVGVPDGYTSYYLNVMAGPNRIWKFYNDPNHEWILKR